MITRVGRKLAALSVLAAGAFATVPAAHADNNSYLAAVGDLTGKAGGPIVLVGAGKQACYLLQPHGMTYMFGIAPNPVADLIWRDYTMFDRPDAVRVVNAAIDNLCPNPNAFGYAS